MIAHLRTFGAGHILPVMTPGKLTGMQRYYLALLWYFRIFGVIFAIAAVLIVGSNFAVPRAQATGNLREIAVVGTVFFTVGCAIYFAATRVLRWYRRQLP